MIWRMMLTAGLNVLGKELLSHLARVERTLVSGPLGCRIGTVGNRAKGFLSQRAGFVGRDGASLCQRETPCRGAAPLPARLFTT